MENQVWQEISGDKGVRIYPYLRKPDIISSNSYIIADDCQVTVIDPGGLPEQALKLVQVINRLQDEQERPVFFFLTHSHLDHCLQLMPALEVESTAPVSVISHTSCADALEGRDPRATVADLMGHEMEEFSIGTRLFSDSGPGFDLPASGSDGLLQAVSNPPGGRTELTSRTVMMPSDSAYTCYHTPGHSPDSICIRTGNILFIGDILFATSPGVAGLYGWNPQDLIRSAGGLLDVFHHEEVAFCCPGHGRVISGNQAASILGSIEKEAAKLAGIQEISPERAHMMADYAADIMTEIDRLFTIIAGRLLFVTHVLDELEEEEEADRLRNAIDPVFIDEMLTEFGQFSREFREGRKREIHVALKAGQITAKLATCFDRGSLARIIDPSFIRRVDRLLRDYSVTFRGFDLAPDLDGIDSSALVHDLVHALSAKPYDEEDILIAEDEAAYLAALVARIAHVNPLESIEFSITCDEDLICRADGDRVRDLLRHMVEIYAVSGARKISVSTGREGQWVIFRVGSTEISQLRLDERGWRFLVRSAALSGGKVSRDDTGGLLIAFSPGTDLI
jgi:glyoxylase-like metal-dependent hydrolase (beta-lactamase superfamily II)